MDSLYKFAITIDINPETYISFKPTDEKPIRKRWRLFTTDVQQSFLLTNMYMASNDSGTLIKDYVFELTKSGNKHLHVFAEGKPLQVVNFQEDFCNKISKKMPLEIKNRCFYIKEIYDSPGWYSYIHKEEPKTNNDPNSPDYIPDKPMFH